jgi:arabinose-5-phosphate isomerase
VAADTPFIAMMRTMSAKGLGAALVVDGDGRLQGIFTDGDLRRQVERGADLRALTAGTVMHPRPKRVAASALAVEGAELMEQHRITAVAVVDAAGKLVGLLTIGDLMRAKVV